MIVSTPSCIGLRQDQETGIPRSVHGKKTREQAAALAAMTAASGARPAAIADDARSALQFRSSSADGVLALSQILARFSVRTSAGAIPPSCFSDSNLDPLPTLRSGSIDRLDDHHITTAHFAGHAGGSIIAHASRKIINLYRLLTLRHDKGQRTRMSNNLQPGIGVGRIEFDPALCSLCAEFV
jgi:hypothetical protein